MVCIAASRAIQTPAQIPGFACPYNDQSVELYIGKSRAVQVPQSSVSIGLNGSVLSIYGQVTDWTQGVAAAANSSRSRSVNGSPAGWLEIILYRLESPWQYPIIPTRRWVISRLFLSVVSVRNVLRSNGMAEFSTIGVPNCIQGKATMVRICKYY